MPLTNIYIDGFNLYYRALEHSDCKWLDVKALVEHVFPDNAVNRIRYFTSRITPTPWDPQKPARQQVYLRALATLPNLTIHYGQFLSHPRVMPLYPQPPSGCPRTVQVLHTEEKGSDVNLATYLLRDGFKSEYEAAIVVSNDSDLIEPIRVVSQELELAVGVLNPQMDHSQVAHGLRAVASFYRTVTRKALRASQFPPVLQDKRGTIRKPDSW